MGAVVMESITRPGEVNDTGTLRVDSGVAAVPGGRLYYEVGGAGHPLVLIHSSITDCRMWDDQFFPFARDGYRVLRYDVRGFGRSGPVEEPYDPIEDLVELFRRVRFGRAHVLGLSAGGALAVAFAILRPELVSSLIAVGCSAGQRPEAPHLARAMDAAYVEVRSATRAGEVDRALDLYLRTWVDGPLRTPAQVDPAFRERVGAMAIEALRRRHEQGEPQTPEPSPFTRVGQIRCPTLVVVGDQDAPFELAGASALAGRIPGARKVVLAGAGHFPNMEQPAAFNGAVLQFLRQVPLSSGHDPDLVGIS
jgi:pimeloyl-ACP methyl ester carboxylesterase